MHTHRSLDLVTWGSAVVAGISFANMAFAATVFAGVVSGILGIIRIMISWREWRAGK